MRVLGLFSGGLDSILAARVVAAAGLDYECVSFETGFVKPERRRIVDGVESGRPLWKRGDGESPALGDGAKLHRIDCRERYLRQVVREPRFGYGGAMNACLDCRVFLLREAWSLATTLGAELLFTGEVVGQRSRDQSHDALERTEAEAGVVGRVLRPLSGGLLPEISGLESVFRLRMHSRSRRQQRDAVRRFGLTDFPVPSGGCCRLADPRFGCRLRDCLSHADPPGPAEDELDRLDTGRHFRIAWNLKLIVGRNEQESRSLRERAGDRWTAQVEDGRGAFLVLEGQPRAEQLPLVAAIAARYGGERAEASVTVLLRGEGSERRIEAAPASPGQLEKWRLR